MNNRTYLVVIVSVLCAYTPSFSQNIILDYYSINYNSSHIIQSIELNLKITVPKDTSFLLDFKNEIASLKEKNEITNIKNTLNLISGSNLVLDKKMKSYIEPMQSLPRSEVYMITKPKRVFLKKHIVYKYTVRLFGYENLYSFCERENLLNRELKFEYNIFKKGDVIFNFHYDKLKIN